MNEFKKKFGIIADPLFGGPCHRDFIPPANFVGPVWRPNEAMLVDYRTCVLDYRTRPMPFAMIVDAINTDKSAGGGHVKPTLSAAKSGIDRAEEFMVHALAEKEPLSAAHAVVHALFALWCLKCRSPVVFLVGDRDASPFIPFLAEAKRQSDSRSMGTKIIQALMSIGKLLHGDDSEVERRLQQERSWAYSADAPGIVMFIDVWDRSEYEAKMEMKISDEFSWKGRPA